MKIKLLIILAIIVSQQKCNKRYYENLIIINNKLNYDIYCVPSYNYPDTSLNFIKKDVIIVNSRFYWIESDTSRIIGPEALRALEVWERWVLSDTLILFVFNKNELENQSWEYTKEHYYKKIFLTYKDLINSNGTIIID